MERYCIQTVTEAAVNEVSNCMAEIVWPAPLPDLYPAISANTKLLTVSIQAALSVLICLISGNKTLVMCKPVRRGREGELETIPR